jgi:hypothetical protein
VKKISRISFYLVATLIFPVVILLACSATAYGLSPVAAGAAAAYVSGQPANLFGPTGIFNTISNILLFVVGALSVVMLIVGGLRYVLSSGKQTAVTEAKNTVLYAIVGLIVALLAYAAINYILGLFLPGSAGGTNV